MVRLRVTHFSVVYQFKESKLGGDGMENGDDGMDQTICSLLQLVCRCRGIPSGTNAITTMGSNRARRREDWNIDTVILYT